MGGPQLQGGLGALEQLLDHLEEELDEQVEAVGVARHQQLVKRVHRHARVPCHGTGGAR